ncbi:hypothetical protein NESM_000507700 [Novymonas esmeraldas]|uniref:Uncharacterized protein n=1 Tax=Novymonas esmeraldas TaxID=1808958 RepID=A0AAW0EQH2_9TRYP
MKVTLKWFLTGKTSVMEDNDSILSPDTTIAELKGLIQIRFGFSSKELLLMLEHLLENAVTLRSIGIVGQPTDPTLTAHVVRESELEVSNLDQDDTARDDDLQEFSHADFMLAMKMLGKEVAVPDDRLVAMRLNAPRQRPAFLDARSKGGDGGAVGPDGAPQPPPDMPGMSKGGIPVYDPRKTEVYQIVSRVRYGPRKSGVDAAFAVQYPGVEEAFPFWDMRAPDPFTRIDTLCSPGEVCLELFYFGEFEAVTDHAGFLTVVRQSLQSKAGVRLRTPLPLREAGCMYPLIAVPVVLHEMDAMELGDVFFEDFGKGGAALPVKGADDGARVAGSGAVPGCAPQ